jgi:HTH-type transcriptional repressor of NAD biosynthesis genes
MKRAVVIGKFYPFHKGHSFLIDSALSQADEVTILVCDSPAYVIPATLRQSWIKHIHPKATVRIITDINDDDNSEAWAQHTLDFLGYAPDLVFTSEDYGKEYARLMKATHVMVDHDRQHIPVSGTRIRSDIRKEWAFLHPVVRADLAYRIVIVGAESTGTTTLSQDLAQALNVPWVPEYGRLYSEAFTNAEHEWVDHEFEHIGATQQSFEREVAQNSQGMIICDTNAFATTIWQHRYMGHHTDAVTAIGDRDIVDLYILTGDEIPFVQDGIRDGEHIRHDMHQTFLKALENQTIPFIVVSGSKEQRLKESLEAIDTHLTSRSFTEVFARRAVHSSPAAQLQ